MASAKPKPKPKAPQPKLTVARVEALGLTVADFVDSDGTGERCVDRVEIENVVLDLGSRLIAVPRKFLPEVNEGQWVKFHKRGDELICEVDMKATLEGQSKLTDLFARLTITDDD